MGSRKKLTNPSVSSDSDKKSKKEKAVESIKLTKSNKTKLVVSFGLKLENSFNFKKMKKDDLNIFQKFLDDSTELSWDEMESRYMRDPDTTDTYVIKNSDFPVYHFGKSGSAFRLHGILADGYFHITRIDPNHKVHK